MRRFVFHTPRASAGFSLLEVVAAMLVLVVGVAGIMGLLSTSLNHSRRAMDTSIAAYIAQMKAEEIRRDDSIGRAMITEIEGLGAPTVPVPFSLDSRFAYSYCGVSVLDPVDDPGDPADDWGVARIIVQYNPSYRSAAEVLYELRFDD